MAPTPPYRTAPPSLGWVGWLIALVVLIVVVVLWIAGHHLTDHTILGLVGALAVAILAR